MSENEKKLNLFDVELEKVLHSYASYNLRGWKDSHLQQVYVDVGKGVAVFKWMLPDEKNDGQSPA